MSNTAADREHWGSRIGLILAAAGNAVGIGNLLRFPSQAGQQGGGAFIIPYIVSLLLFGIPMMWLAWWVGRNGGKFGHGSTPGMFEKLTGGSKAGLYLGVLGLAIPIVFCWYYTYIESWMLGYSYLSLTGHYNDVTDFGVYLDEYLQNVPTGNYIPGIGTCLTFLAITLALNIWILARGITKGIELLAKVAMPVLLLFCITLALRVLTSESEAGSAADGLGYIWNPDFERILDAGVWLAAAGQIFFTLSIGFGSMESYASYVKEDDDIVLNALTTTSTNEFIEIVFGSLIAIPATAIFLGASQVEEIANGGAFNIGLIAMPRLMQELHPIWFFGTMWFLLLFLAAFTSSVAVAQPVVAFFQDELGLNKTKAAAIVGLFWICGTIPVVVFNRYGYLDQLDFLAGTLLLVVFALVEIFLVLKFVGAKRYWQELHKGADIKAPEIFYFITKYITPIALAAILVGWVYGEVSKGYPSLKATPKLQESIDNIRELVPNRETKFGTIKHENLKGIDGEKDARKSAAEKTVAELQSLCASLKHDITISAEVRVENGSNIITNIRSENAVAADLVRNLIINHRQYELHTGGRTAKDIDKIKLIIEVLYTTPYVWMARLSIVAMIILFIIFISIAWRKRINPA